MDILNKTSIMTSKDASIFFIAAILIFIVSLLISIFTGNMNPFCFGCVMMVFFIILGIIYPHLNVHESGRYRYEVIFHQGFSAQELLEKYEIVDQRGKIWVIEDKEIENTE